MADEARTVDEVLAEHLGPPTEREQTLAWRLSRPTHKGISPRQARALLKSNRRKKTTKLPADVSLDNLEDAASALRRQLAGIDDDVAKMIEQADSIWRGLNKLMPHAGPPPERVRRDKAVRELDALLHAVRVVRGWLEQVVKVSGYKGGRDPHYAAICLALYAGRAYRERTGKLPEMPASRHNARDKPFTALLCDLFPCAGLDEGSIWNAGDQAVDQIANEYKETEEGNIAGDKKM
jgi:hypothetical protein